MRSFKNKRLSQRYVVMGCALLATLVMGVVLGMAFTTSKAEAQAGRSFSGSAGMMLNYINADATGDFEALMSRLGEALRNSDDADRRQQAEGWKVFRAAEPGPGGSVLYVWFIDPAVSGADYAVSAILNEAFPEEVQELYETYNGSFASGQAMVNLDLVSDF